MLNRLLIVCLTALLLLAQQGSVLHALSHVAEASATQSTQQKHPASKQTTCNECLAYAALGAALNATTGQAQQAAIAQHETAAQRAAVFVAAPAHFNPRAPPRSISPLS